RTLTIVVRPLDFQEFADFRGFNFGRTDTGAREKLLDLFLQTGGYPEYVREQNPLYFADLVSNTIHKDIVLLFGIKNGLILRQALSLTADRVGAQTSYSKLGRVLSLSKDTVRDYLYYLSSTFLIGELKKFALSRNEQIYSPRKYYLTDNGLLFNLLGRFSAGAGAENAVFNKLSEGDWGFYYENQRDIDFVNKDGDGYEVKYELSTENWEKFLRNVRGLSTEKFKKITLLTQQPRQEIVVGKIKIQCEKLSEFLFWN
ncbi:MAG: hypothetical protein Q8N98_00225, partial [bacterium]|nr:hypothetical protein [bacterium]